MTKLSLFLLSAAFVAVPFANSGNADQSGPTPTVEYRVKPGETLWAIAARIPGVDDRREAVHRLKELNELGPESLQIGQRILVPAPE